MALLLVTSRWLGNLENEIRDERLVYGTWISLDEYFLVALSAFIAHSICGHRYPIGMMLILKHEQNPFTGLQHRCSGRFIGQALQVTWQKSKPFLVEDVDRFW